MSKTPIETAADAVQEAFPLAESPRHWVEEAFGSLAQHRDEMARLMRTLDANSPEDRERLGRWWDERATSPDVVEKAYARVDAVLAYLTGEAS